MYMIYMKIANPIIDAQQWGPVLLKHWGQEKMAPISQSTFLHASSMKIVAFWLKFHWNMFAKRPINNNPAQVQIMAWRQRGAKPLSEPMMA